jgi:hypothetical protein
MSDLEQAFNQDMAKTYQEAVKIGYRPARFLQMLSENGGVETARIILSQPNTTDGFTTLWEKKRLDLSVEAVVLKPEYAPLFSADDRAKAQARLAEVDYTPPPQSTPAPASTTLVDRLAHAVETIQGGERSRTYDSPKLDPLIAIFKQRFPSFTSQEYLCVPFRLKAHAGFPHPRHTIDIILCGGNSYDELGCEPGCEKVLLYDAMDFIRGHPQLSNAGQVG